MQNMLQKNPESHLIGLQAMSMPDCTIPLELLLEEAPAIKVA